MSNTTLFFFVCVLNHASQQNIDFVLTVTEVTALDEVVVLLTPSTGWCVQFEGPQEVRCVFEVWSNCEHFMNQILHTLNVGALLQFTLDSEIVGDWHTLSLVLNVTTLVHQSADRLQIGVSPCDIWLSNTQHVDGGLVQLDEYTIVDLTQTEQLQNLANLWCNFVDTANRCNDGR